jgi:hypothetical protein
LTFPRVLAKSFYLKVFLFFLFLGHFLLMLIFCDTDKTCEKRINGEGYPLKIMSVSEVTTFAVQKQLLNEKTGSVDTDFRPEADISLQMKESDVVTLSYANEQYSPQPDSELQIEVGQTVQEISSVAQAASTFSQVVEGGLNEDELVAIQRLTAKIEPVAKEFLSSDPEEFNIEQAVDVALSDTVSNQTENSEFDIENIRQLPQLVNATIDAGFQKQFQALNQTNRELIVSSLSELMQFFREKVVQVLEPLRHPGALNENITQVPVEADLVEQS